MSRVVVIGAGVAGTAAALSAARAGARVTIVDGGTGASTLWTGAIDGSTGLAPEDAAALASSLGVVLVSAIVATTTALARRAAGHDVAILNLQRLIGARTIVGVVQCERPGWDAELVVRSLHDGAIVVDATLLRHVDERALPDADFAQRHDDPTRLGWLAERLREGLQRSGARPGALLLPPSLGIDRSRAEELSKLVGVPCGEALGLPGGPAGLRFEAARDRALASSRVEVVHGRANRIQAADGKWRVSLGENGDGAIEEAGAVVVTTGGLVGGGLEYQSSEWILAAALPPYAREPFRCTLDGPLALGAHGKPLEVPGSLYGVPPESIAWPFVSDPLMARVGVLCAPDGRVAPGLYAAGEIAADLPRTWLAALESGARAGAAASREALTGTSTHPASASAASATRP